MNRGSQRISLAAFAYRPGRSSFHTAHPLVAALPLIVLGTTALVVESPIVIGSVVVAAWLIGRAVGARTALAQALRFSIPLAVLMVVVNGLISHAGATVIFRGPDIPVVGGAITLEAFAAGAVIAMRIVAVALLFAIWSACVDPDRVLMALRPVARHSALTATLVSRLVPVAAADYERLVEASRLRGPAAAPVGRAQLARRVVVGSLDRSVEVAATLELRGHSLSSSRFDRRSRNLVESLASLLSGGAAPLVSAILMSAAIGVALGVGAGSFTAYPSLRLDLSPITVALAAALPFVALLGCVKPRRVPSAQVGKGVG